MQASGLALLVFMDRLLYSSEIFALTELSLLGTKLCRIRVPSLRALSLALVVLVSIGSTGCRQSSWRRAAPDSGGFGLAPSVDEDDHRNCIQGPHESGDQEGCVNGHTQHFSLAFVEFDDAGELWSIGDQRWDRPQDGEKNEWPKSQLENAVEVVNARRADAQAKQRPLLVLTFVHGWHNDASPYDEEHDQNLNSFKHSLEYLATHTQDQTDCGGDQCPVVVGVFLAWRGKIVQDSFLHAFTYANRRNAANRVGGVSMTEAIMLLSFAAKGAPAPYDEENQCQQPDAITRQTLETNRKTIEHQGIPMPSVVAPAQFFLIGHSFGGRALLHGTAQAVLALILEQKAQAEACVTRWNQIHPDRSLDHVTVAAPIDLIALINPADDAFATKSMIEAFKRNGITANDVNHPLMLSIKADGDLATGPVMWLGQTIAGGKPNMHSYDRGIAHHGVQVSADDPPPHPSACEEGQLGLKAQVFYYKHSAPGIYNMASHLIADFGFKLTRDACDQRAPDFLGETFVWSPASPIPGTTPASCLAIIPVKSILEIDNGAYSSDKSKFTVSPQQFYSCPPTGVDGEKKYVGPWNDTPFFVMHAPRALIPNHNDIFRPGMFDLLVQLTTSSPGPTILKTRSTPRTMPNQTQAPVTSPRKP